MARPRGLPALHSGADLPKGLKPGRQYTQIRGQVRVCVEKKKNTRLNRRKRGTISSCIMCPS